MNLVSIRRALTLACLALASLTVAHPASAAPAPCKPFSTFPLSVNIGTALNTGDGEPQRCINQKVMDAVNNLQTGVSNLSALTIPAPSQLGQPAGIAQIFGSTYSLAQEGGWGKSQADNDRIFGIALNYSTNTDNGPVTIDVPMGTWRLKVPRYVTTTKPFKLRCSGRGQTRILVDTGGASLLTISQQTPGAQVSIEGCEFAAAAPGVGTPIVISYAGTAAGPSPFNQYSTALLRDLSFVGSDHTPTTGINYFNGGIDITNGWAPLIEGIHFTGSVQSQRAAQAALTFRYTFSPQIENLFVYYATRGIYDPGGATNGQNSEGLSWRSGEIIGVDYGVDLVGTDSDPGLFINNVHVNAAKSCIRTVWKAQLAINNILCYKLPDSADAFTGIDVSYAAFGYINNIQIGDSRSSNLGGTFGGVKLTNSTGVTVNGVQAQGWQNNTNFLLYLEGTTDYVRAFNVDASLIPGLQAVAINSATAGKNNYIYDALPALVQGLAVNSATPGVGNDLSGLWSTSNTAATTITNFLNMRSGQEISVIFLDGVTTIAHSSGLRLKGAVNTSPPAGSSMTFKAFGATIYETGRSF